MKTRLAASLGSNAACLAYKALVERLLENLKEVRNVELRFAPDDARNEILAWLQRDWTASPQGPGDLGARLEAAFEAHFGAGQRRVVIIGSDCPYVTTNDILAAWSALEEVDLALGPAGDGGYWLIGLRKLHRALFHEMPWSSPSVFNKTLNRACTAGLTTRVLRTLDDVDALAGWKRFQRSQSGAH